MLEVIEHRKESLGYLRGRINGLRKNPEIANKPNKRTYFISAVQIKPRVQVLLFESAGISLSIYDYLPR